MTNEGDSKEESVNTSNTSAEVVDKPVPVIKEKNPKRVAAGKRLSEYNKMQKEMLKKHIKEIESDQSNNNNGNSNSYNSDGGSSSSTVKLLIVAVTGFVIAGGVIYYNKKQIKETISNNNEIVKGSRTESNNNNKQCGIRKIKW